MMWLTSLLQPESLESVDDEEKWELTNTRIVTYTPYCGGSHMLTINIGDESTKRKIIVCGTPPVGSRVMKGPNAYSTVDAKVVSHKESIKTITVKALMWKGVRYGFDVLKEVSWGRNGQYQIQLKHKNFEIKIFLVTTFTSVSRLFL